MFFTAYKERKVFLGDKVDVYRNLHSEGAGYSIRCNKTKLVLAHCSAVSLTDAKFHVSESGRMKTVDEKRKRVHAYITGTLKSINQEPPECFSMVYYNPYKTPLFLNTTTNRPVLTSEEVYCMGKHSFVVEGEEKIQEIVQLDLMGDLGLL
ncbi:hypothetical protein [Niallia sp. FSL R7-0271]|uniref:hypothetical protein n=1 Tax=Niallia sp. FSL R7-0271 TaxID=2921678 RepID=UPI0030FB96CC